MKKDFCIKFALQICDACSQNNYHRVFKLAQNAPKMCGYLIDWFAERLRKEALKCMIKSYVYLHSSFCSVIFKTVCLFTEFGIYSGTIKR